MRFFVVFAVLSSVAHAAPALTALSPSSGPTTGGIPITLSGSGFGASGARVVVGSDDCAVTAQSDALITCTLPSGVGTNHSVRALVAGELSNALPFSYLPPVISSLTPSTGPTSGGTSLTLTGTSFGASGATVTVGGESCPIQAQGHTQVVCRAPEGAGIAKPVVVTQAGQSSAPASFSYGPPALLSVSPSTGPTSGGAVITVTGANFGVSGAAVTVAGRTCEGVTHDLGSAHTALRCTLPEGQGSAAELRLTAAGQSVTAGSLYGYQPPLIGALSPSAGPTSGGTLLTLTGSNFGLSPGVTVGGEVCPVLQRSHSTVVCAAPAGQGTALPVRLSAGDQSVTASLSYDAPLITALTPSSGPTSGGVALTLSGQSFGSTGAQVVVGAQPCPLVSQSHGRVVCTLPAGAGAADVRLLVAGQASTAFPFSYGLPVLSSLSPTEGPTTGGVPLTLMGQNFGTSPSVTVGGQSCTVTSSSQSQVVCTAPQGSGVSLPVVLVAQGQSSNALSFSYLPPLLSSLSPQNGPRRGGTVLTLSGQNFGASGASVIVDGQACPVLAQAHGQLTCQTPSSALGKAAVQLAQAGQRSNTLTFSYVDEAPSAQDVSGATAEDTPVTLTLSGSDPDGDPLSYSVVSPPTGAQGTVSISGDQATFAPALDFHGAAAFTVKASDGVLESNTATVSITVSPVNDAPVAQPQSVSTPRGAPRDIPLTASDAEGDALTFRLETTPPGSEGTVTLLGATATFQPSAGFVGVSSFQFVASDGALDSAAATVTVAVSVTGGAPQVVGKAVSTAEDTPVSFALEGVDGEGDSLTFQVVTPPSASEGRLLIEGAQATFTPARDFHGDASFSFNAHDGTFVSAPATVMLTVTPVNDPPVAAAQVLTTPLGTAKMTTLSAQDAEGDALTYRLVELPPESEGQATLEGAALTFTPAPGFAGQAQVVFEASDGEAVSTATIVWAVHGAPSESPEGGGCASAGAGGGLWLAAWVTLIALAPSRRRAASARRRSGSAQSRGWRGGGRAPSSHPASTRSPRR